MLVPVGGKDTLRSFEDIRDNILNKTIWGVDFYLLCDRDAVNSLGKKAIAENTSARIKQLPRYHLENYFLDGEVLARVFSSMEPNGSPLCNANRIAETLREIAKSVIPYAVALNVAASIREVVGNASIMPKGIDGSQTIASLTVLMQDRARNELSRVEHGLNNDTIALLISDEFSRLSSAVTNDDPIWRTDLPGRVILNKFAASAGMKQGRLKQLYLNQADVKQTFRDVVEIFQSFRDGVV